MVINGNVEGRSALVDLRVRVCAVVLKQQLHLRRVPFNQRLTERLAERRLRHARGPGGISRGVVHLTFPFGEEAGQLAWVKKVVPERGMTLCERRSETQALPVPVE